VLLTETGRAEPAVAFLSVSGQALGAMSAGQRSLSLGLRWEGDDQLLIIHPANAASQLPAGTYGGVKVHLQAGPARGKP